MQKRRHATQGGFTYLAVLIAVAVLGIGLAAASEVWSTTARRDRLAQAEWAGKQYAQAVGSYYESALGGARVYPQDLTALLDDRRGVVVRRHLRTLYGNPFSTDGQWQLARLGGAGIVGVKLTLPEGFEPRERTYVYSPTNRFP